jgi:hypothetical protein
MSSTVSPVNNDLLTLLKGDVLTTYGPPLLAFLQAIIGAAGDPAKIGVAWLQLQANLIAASPTILAEIEAQLAQVLVVKIQSAKA